MKAHLQLHVACEDESGFAWASIHQYEDDRPERIADFQENLLILDPTADNVISEMMAAVNAFMRHWREAQNIKSDTRGAR